MFLAEGAKTIIELLPHFECRFLAATNEVWQKHAALLQRCHIAEIAKVSQEDLSKASLLQNPKDALALFALPQADMCLADCLILPQKNLCLALDGVQDPGNLGTIIRLADWFGIGHIFCSPTTVDAFSPKVVQATMGAIARVKVHYLNLPLLVQQLPSEVPIYGTLLEGENLYEQELSPHGLLIMGNEGNGISATLKPYIRRQLLIPNFPKDRDTSESLNVAIATAIACAEFRRRQI